MSEIYATINTKAEKKDLSSEGTVKDPEICRQKLLLSLHSEVTDR